MITFADYEGKAMSLAVYPNHGNNLIYPALKLAGEAGEVADKIGKLWRNNNITSWENMPLEERRKILYELGDVLWYIAAIANELHVTLTDVALLNIEKLNDRVARGVIKGEGDAR